MTVDITISEEASRHLREELEGRILRISFTTGCGGSGYRLASAEAPVEGDTVVELDSIQLALDDMSAKKLTGATIEWDQAEDGYTLNHPDAVTAVWCG